MTPANDRLSQASGYVFSDQTDVFAVYLEENAGDATLTLPDGSFDVRWFDPRAGGELQTGSVDAVEGGSSVDLGNPPSAPQQDWVVKISRVE